MPMKWTAQADARLLVEILKIHKIQINYEALAAAMSEFEKSTVTPKAIKLQIGKLRAASKAEPRVPNGNGLLTPKTTPRKGAAKRKIVEDEEDDDDEGQYERKEEEGQYVKEEIKWEAEADEIEEQKPKIKKRRVVVRAKQEHDSENMSSD